MTLQITRILLSPILESLTFPEYVSIMHYMSYDITSVTQKGVSVTLKIIRKHKEELENGFGKDEELQRYHPCADGFR